MTDAVDQQPVEPSSSTSPSAADAGRFDAFISYAREDADAATRLRAALGELGHEVWIDVEGIVAGADWRARIMRAIEACTAFVFLISPDSVGSAVCLWELDQAAALNKLIVPVGIHAITSDRLPPTLAGRDSISMRDVDDFDAGVGRLIEALRTDLDWREQHTRLAGRTREWLDAGRDRSFVLRGGDLRDAEGWLGRQGDHPQSPTAEHAEYIVASRRAATVRQRALLASAAGAVLITLTLASFALVQRNAADHDRRVAVSRGVSAQAVAIADQDPGLAAALSLEADRIQPTAEARRAIDGVLPRLGPSLGDLSGHTDIVYQAVVSPDGRTVASVGTDKTVRLWDLATRTALGGPLTSHTALVSGVAFSPDGNTLATASHDKTVRLWDVATRRPLGRPLTGHTRAVNKVAFSPDGTRLASAGIDRTLRLWDVATRRPAGSAARGRGDHPIMSLAFSPDGKTLATGDVSGAVQLRAAATNRPAGKPLRGHSGYVWDVAFSPDGATLATGGEDETTRLWSVARRRPLGPPLTRGLGVVRGVAFSPDGGTLASANDDGVQLWSIATHDPIGSPLGPLRLPFSVAFDPGGKTLVSADAQATVSLWNVASQTTAAPTAVPIEPLGKAKLVVNKASGLTIPSGAAFSPDGTMLATATGDTVQLLSTATRSALGARLSGHRGPVLGVAFSPDAKTLATAGADSTVRLWSVAGRRPLGAPLTGHRAETRSVTFSPDGTTLASAGDDGTVRLWSVTTRRSLGEPLVGQRNRPVQSVAFSPDGTILASADSDATVRLWSVASRRPPGTPLTGHSGPISAVAFSPDGTTLASAGADGTVRLWNVVTRRPRGAPLTGHTAGVDSVAFSPDGRTLASGGRLDKTIRLWDVATRRPVGAPLGGRFLIGDTVTFSPNGTTLASVDSDANGRSAVWLWDSVLWSRNPRAREARTCAAARRNLSRAEWSTYLPGEPYHTTCPQP